MVNEIKRLIKSFGHALKGLKFLFSSQRNAVIHLLLMFCAIVMGFMFQISNSEWIMIIFCSAFVIAAEAFNTALEKMADAIHPDKHDGIGNAKDLAAGSVLIMAIAALIVGIIIFLPKLYSWVNSI
mgnify:FL=1